MEIRKFLTTTLLVLMSTVMVAQGGATATLADHSADPGSIVVPVTVSSFADIAAITLHFSYDPAVVSYNGFQNAALPGMEANAFNLDGVWQVGISWSNATNVTVPDGALIEIKFTYTSGSCDFDFLSQLCEVTDEDGVPVIVEYNNGSIGPLHPALVSLPLMVVNQAPATSVQVPLAVDFSAVTSGVSSFTFVVAYNAATLTYQSVSNTALSPVTVTQLSNPDRLSFEWSNLYGGSVLNGKLLDINFTYNGGSSALDFDVIHCAVGNLNNEDVPAIYTNGSITPDPGSAVVVTASTIDAPAGTVVEVPLTTQNFTNIGAFDFQIAYDPMVLEFVALTGANLPAATVVNATGGVLAIGWDAGTGSALNLPGVAELLKMKFNFIGNASTLGFLTSNCAVSDFGLNPLFVTYNNGAVNQAATAFATIETVVSLPDAVVQVPLTTVGFGGIGAFDFAIQVPTDKVTFVELVNPHAELAKGSLMYNFSQGVLYVSWGIDPTELEGITIPDGAILFEMKFNYQQGEAPLTFRQQGCSVSQFDLLPLQVSYTDGGVTEQTTKILNLKLFLEGLYNTETLRMNKAKDYTGGAVVDKFEGTVAEQITVELHLSTSYGTIVYSDAHVNLNTDGTATVAISPALTGSCYVAIKTRNHIETVSANTISLADLNITCDFTSAATQAYGSNMRLLSTGVYGLFAGDVNQDGVVNGNDRSQVNGAVINIATGYLDVDVDGNGVVNGNDRSMANGNVIRIIQSMHP